MAIADRKFGADVAVMTIDAHDMLARFQTTDIEKICETIQNTAVKDTEQINKARPSSWRMAYTGAVETFSDDNLDDHVGTEVAVVVSTAAIDGDGVTYSGDAILTRFKHNISDAQTIELELVGQGALTAEEYVTTGG